MITKLTHKSLAEANKSQRLTVVHESERGDGIAYCRTSNGMVVKINLNDFCITKETNQQERNKMKYIEQTHQELRDKAADALRESRRYNRGTASNHVCQNEYHAYALAAMKLKNAMFRERCAAKGVEV